MALRANMMDTLFTCYDQTGKKLYTPGMRAVLTAKEVAEVLDRTSPLLLLPHNAVRVVVDVALNPPSLKGV